MSAGHGQLQPVPVCVSVSAAAVPPAIADVHCLQLLSKLKVNSAKASAGDLLMYCKSCWFCCMCTTAPVLQV